MVTVDAGARLAASVMEHGMGQLLQTASLKATQHKDESAKSCIERIAVGEIPLNHPVRMINDHYMQMREACEVQHLPALDMLMQDLSTDLSDYCILLRPIEADTYIDFLVLHRGAKMPGVELVSVCAGEKYSDHLSPTCSQERLMELASCLALKKPRLSLTHSARQSTLQLKVFRGVFPVWDPQIQQHAVLLAVAPIYTTMALMAKPS